MVRARALHRSLATRRTETTEGRRSQHAVISRDALQKMFEGASEVPAPVAPRRFAKRTSATRKNTVHTLAGWRTGLHAGVGVGLELLGSRFPLKRL